jgi:hypothetical protein
MPAGWVFDLVLETLAEDLERGQPDLARKLRNAKTDVSVGFLDLAGLDATTLSTLHQAVERTHDTFQRRGASSFHNPAFFPGFMAKLEELQRLVASDPRLSPRSPVSSGRT